MLSPRLLYLLSLVVYVYGALAFAALAASYLRQRLAGRAGASALGFFTIDCALAFALNVALQIWPGPEAWLPRLAWLQSLATGLVPALLLHLVAEECWPRQRRLPLLLAPAYLLCAATSLFGRGLWDAAPAALLAASALASALAHWAPPRLLAVRYRLLRALLLLLLAASSLLTLSDAQPILAVLPDYLLLAIFATTLYYRERLSFFDLLVKRGLFSLAGLGLYALLLATGEPWLSSWAEPASRPWLLALLLTPLWILAPWLDRFVARLIDRAWLGRALEPAAAEQLFAAALQSAESPEAVRQAALAPLTVLFRAPARLSAEPGPAALSQPFPPEGAPLGYILLDPRPGGVPFLSADLSLLRALARTLASAIQSAESRQRLLAQQLREEELRTLASRAELRALRAQINPHFLFNALNSIAGLIQLRPELADETLEHLAQVFRYTLRKSDSEWTRLDEELEFITSYLRVEQARFGARLQLEFDIDPAARPVQIPALSLQPLVENAIKHGVSAVEGPALVRVQAACREGHLALVVFNSGPAPRPFALKPGHGLHNVDARLRGYYGAAARLAWSTGADGTRVTLELPLAPEIQPA